MLPKNAVDFSQEGPPASQFAAQLAVVASITGPGIYRAQDHNW